MAAVKRSAGIDRVEILLERRFQLDSAAARLTLPPGHAARWIYRGKHPDLRTTVTLMVDHGVLRDTKVVAEGSVPAFEGLLAPEAGRREADPADRFSLPDNLATIPLRNRLPAITLLVVGIPLILANAALGWHDQMSSESATLCYDHEDSDGESQNPQVNALMASGGIGFALWLALRAKLRCFMEIELPASRVPGRIEPDTRLRVQDIVRGGAWVARSDCVLRVVAFNRKKGQYQHRSKDKTKAREFAEIARAVVLCELRLPHVPAESPLGQWLDGEVDFARLFTQLHPPTSMGARHGIDIRWEVQWVHPQSVDQEVALPEAHFAYPLRTRGDGAAA